MQIWDEPSAVPSDWPASVVTIGVFDGVHRGHRELIKIAVDNARAAGLPAVVLTFWPNPAEIVRPGEPPARLSTLQQRLALIAELGVDATLALPFSEEFAQASPEYFAGSVLSDVLAAAHVVVGENFRFGHRAKGTVATLTELGRRLGFRVSDVHLLTANQAGDPVSSSLIRQQVADGEVAAAARALVRPHRVEGVVVRGAGRGKDLGFPTANLAPTPFPAIPADGVYAGRIVVDPYGDKRVEPAAISVGSNPTFEDKIERRIESWAYDAGDIDLYDQAIAVDFVERIRDQQKFASEDQLRDAVAQDVALIRQIVGG